MLNFIDKTRIRLKERQCKERPEFNLGFITNKSQGIACQLDNQYDNNKPNLPNQTQFNEKNSEENKNNVINSEKITRLINTIQASKEKKIIPTLNLNDGKLSFPLLAKIGEDESNLQFLEKLASPSVGILEKTIHERFVSCPEHSNSLSISIRLTCSTCKSMNIEKLHLFEHKSCGHIAEKKNFYSKSNEAQCRSCNKIIKDLKKEIQIPAMWYRCYDCNAEFDDVSIKLHCRKFNHDFDTNLGHPITIPSFKLKNTVKNFHFDIPFITGQLKNLLSSSGFSCFENYLIRGKSGQNHNITIFGKDKENRTIFIFIENAESEIDESIINSRVVEVLDTLPNFSMLVGIPSISKKAQVIASAYNITTVTAEKPEEIISSARNILSKKLENLVIEGKK